MPDSLIHRLPLWLRTGWLTCGLALICLVPIAHAQEDLPALTGRVVDLAGLLDSSQESALSAQLEEHENKTSNQLVVVTLPSLNGNQIADYANRLGRFWKIGTAEEDNGVLLVVAPNDRKVRIEVGYGLEGALTDSLSSIIIQREILPPFRSDNYALGIRQGVTAITQAIAGEYKAPVSSDRDSSDPISDRIGTFLPLIFIAMVGIPEILRRRGLSKAAKGAFPAGFAGLFMTLASGSLLIGLAAAVVTFLFVYFIGTGKGDGGSGRSRRGGHVGGGGFNRGGFGGGGGFSGGGGSFGGGGASGGW